MLQRLFFSMSKYMLTCASLVVVEKKKNNTSTFFALSEVNKALIQE